MNVCKIYTSKGVWDVVFDLNVDKHSWKNQRLILLIPQADITITWKKKRYIYKPDEWCHYCLRVK